MLVGSRAVALTCLLRACWAGAPRNGCWLLQDPAVLLGAPLLAEASVVLGGFLQSQTSLGKGITLGLSRIQDLASIRSV